MPKINCDKKYEELEKNYEILLETKEKLDSIVRELDDENKDLKNKLTEMQPGIDAAIELYDKLSHTQHIYNKDIEDLSGIMWMKKGSKKFKKKKTKKNKNKKKSKMK